CGRENSIRSRPPECSITGGRVRHGGVRRPEIVRERPPPIFIRMRTSNLRFTPRDFIFFITVFSRFQKLQNTCPEHDLPGTPGLSRSNFNNVVKSTGGQNSDAQSCLRSFWRPGVIRLDFSCSCASYRPAPELALMPSTMTVTLLNEGGKYVL